MVSKGFAPSKDGASKFVEGIQKEGDAVLLESVLCQLAKVSALESSGWEKAVSGALDDPAELSIEKQLLPPFQIICHSKNLGESKFFKFDQIYMTR